LSPDDDPLIARAELQTVKGSLMLVGHLPHLSRLASLLVTGDQEREIVNFPTSSVTCLSYSGGSWSLEWTLAPENV
jgi:phosphohistidine phosphatase